MDELKIQEVLELIGHTRIGVIGDFCLDAYWVLDTSPPEKSLETGKPTSAVLRQRYSLGGAGNVASNLADLGVGTVYAFGVINDDIFGREMLMHLRQRRVNIRGMITQPIGWDTPVYAKPYLGTDEQNRMDFGRFNMIGEETEEKLISAVIDVLPELDALIVNQQLPRGIYSKGIVESLNRLAATNPEKFFLLDSRNRSHEFRNMICKMNACEAARICGDVKELNEFIPVEDLKRYAHEIIHLPQKALFITRSGRGILLSDGKSCTEIPGIQILRKIDPVGAGDTTVSAIASALAAGATLEEAGILGNLASAVTVQKLQQTGTATPQEILDLTANADYIYRPELADDIRWSEFLRHTEIEIANPDVELGRIEHAIFDHDGTISSLRQGWEAIMEPVMVRSILGDAYHLVGEEQYQRVLKRVRDYIDQSTGIETIQQMHTLAEMVRELGFVQERKILDAYGYKQIYNASLMEQVNFRLEKLKRGELGVSDYMIKGAMKFLEALHQRGVRLYLASGTDRSDVICEAESLGYAKFFEGRIYGSLGDVTKNTKRIVLESIIRENRLSGSQVVCFGDGPVELRETKKCGGVAVGVASDEVRRYGLNPAKRSRLIKAGADLVIPDFSQGNSLLRVLFEQEKISMEMGFFSNKP